MNSEAIRSLLAQLLSHPADFIESDTVEVKSWCKDEKDLSHQVADAASCLANSKGGLIIVGADDKAPGYFSACPHPNVRPDWLVNRIHDQTVPPVECTGMDLTQALREIAASGSPQMFGIDVERTRHLSGHRTSAGISKERVGKSCQPQYVAEDDRTSATFPGAHVCDLSAETLAWARAQHTRNFPSSNCDSDTGLLTAIPSLLPRGASSVSRANHPITLGALLLFGSESSLQRLRPEIETILVTSLGEHRFRRNLIDSVRILMSEVPPLLGPSKKNAEKILHELFVNAYVHRCYRTQGPITVICDGTSLTVANPGSAAGGVAAGALLYSTPVYRNFTVAEAARMIGLCDKVGSGINTIFKLSLTGGLDLPMFNSEGNQFACQLPLSINPTFQRFLESRAQSLYDLDEIIVLRRLVSDQIASVGELISAMQRPNELGRKVIRQMIQKNMIAQVDHFGKQFALTGALRFDIENVFSSGQYDLFGEPA